ncbi:MAG TPA: hypothetical protein VFQ87_01680 [Bradyrhizobium sp.]|jgi:hypothetical protein|nr:hypothetical protein [Bradyrhizobium sp.]
MTTHKKRTAWFQARAAWPYREPTAHSLLGERSRANAALAPQPGNAQWELIGPTNVGGRMTSVACAPKKPETIWAGAAGGGVWKSDDGGQHWHGLWHSQPTLNIGSMAVDPNNPATVYCGTGEANLSADSYPGVGIFRSADGGESWQILAPADATGIPTRIGCLVVDPFDSTHLCLGGVTHSAGGSDGMFASRNGGLSWGRLTFPGSGPYRCHAIVFHPTIRDTFFATISARGAQSGIWKSTNGGTSWTHLKNGLPSPELIERTSLAIAASQPSVIYAISSAQDESVLGVFRSSDGGASWVNIAGTHFVKEGQMSYGNTIAVHPANPDHVLCGGVDLHLTRNGGKTWVRTTRWDAERGRPNYAHADHHCLLMPVEQPGLVYDMNDGGMDVSLDGGLTWTNRSNGLAVSMFYDVDVAQSDGRMFGGGLQDNGTNLTLVGEITTGDGKTVTLTGKPDDFIEITGGDGGWMLIDPKNTGHLYTTSQNMTVNRFRKSDGWTDASPPAKKSEQDAVWMVFLEFDPKDSRTVFAGGLRVWRTRDDGNNWRDVSPVLDGSPISAVEIAQADPKKVYVGTEKGGIFRSLDGGNTWSGDLAGPVLPGFTVTRILTSPTDAQIVYATVANFNARHVFRSRDGGQTWTDIDRGQLPDVPHHAIVIPGAKPMTLYVCSDAGVFGSSDGGDNWKSLTRNLPTVPIVDLVYHEADGTLTAASYGRSMWRLKV